MRYDLRLRLLRSGYENVHQRKDDWRYHELLEEVLRLHPISFPRERDLHWFEI